MTETDGLISALLLDGEGGGRELSWGEIATWQAGDGLLWIHLDRNAERSCRWLREESGLDAITAEALLAEETRPRSFATADGLLVILRGVNLNPGADPEDMVSLRIYIDDKRIITLRYRRLMAVADIVDHLQQGNGPRASGSFLAMVAERLVARIEPVMDSLGERADGLENELDKDSPARIREQLRELRKTAIVLKRYLAPQRDILARLQVEQLSWLTDHNRQALREVADRIARYVEELEELRERAAVLQDELSTRLAEAANRTIYILTVVAAIMLPLSFITGLLGINVGGMPGSDDKGAFWLVCLLLLGFGLGELWLFRRLKWI